MLFVLGCLEKCADQIAFPFVYFFHAEAGVFGRLIIPGGNPENTRKLATVSGEYSDPIALPVDIPFCLGRESRRIIFLLISRSLQSKLLQYNFRHLDPAAFGFCQG
ncbi:hypothetical protein V6N13_135890 [Hibiscus sabdariffa]